MGGIYACGGDNFSAVAVEGISMNLNRAVEKYKREGTFRKKVEFGPLIVNENRTAYVSGNIYFPEICILSASQNLTKSGPNTFVQCSSTSYGWALHLLVDFTKKIDFQNVEPSEILKTKVKNGVAMLETLWESTSEF